jgi:asparagine synthetase B (glutamine-hydrolysing)
VSPLLPAAPILLLFSGGVDSTLLAVLAHRSLPSGVPIDLVNVCFDHGRSPDRLAALDALEELRAVAPDRCWRLILVRPLHASIT